MGPFVRDLALKGPCEMLVPFKRGLMPTESKDFVPELASQSSSKCNNSSFASHIRPMI